MSNQRRPVPDNATLCETPTVHAQAARAWAGRSKAKANLAQSLLSDHQGLQGASARPPDVRENRSVVTSEERSEGEAGGKYLRPARRAAPSLRRSQTAATGACLRRIRVAERNVTEQSAPGR